MLRRCLLVSCVLLIATGAHAETLDITGGSIISDGLLNDTLFGFGGPTFNVQGVNFDKTYLGGPTFFIGFSPQPSMPAGQVSLRWFPTLHPANFYPRVRVRWVFEFDDCSVIPPRRQYV